MHTKYLRFSAESIYLLLSCLCRRSHRAAMQLCAICSVSNLLSLWSVPRLGTTSRNLSKASFNPFMRRLSRAFAARRRRLSTVGDGGTSRDLRRPFRGLTGGVVGIFWIKFSVRLEIAHTQHTLSLLIVENIVL